MAIRIFASRIDRDRMANRYKHNPQTEKSRSVRCYERTVSQLTIGGRMNAGNRRKRRKAGRPRGTTGAKPGAMAPETLRRARQQAGLSQAALAERLGVTRTTVAAWERGTTPISRITATAVVVELGG